MFQTKALGETRGWIWPPRSRAHTGKLGISALSAVLGLALLGSACSEGGGENLNKRPRIERKAPSSKDLPAVEKQEKKTFTAQELRFRLFPLIKAEVRPDQTTDGKAGGSELEGLLSLDPLLGLAVHASVYENGAYRPATDGELSLAASLDVSLGEIYRGNLARLLREASMLSIGQPGGSRFLYLDTALAGVESLILLPETWNKVDEALGQAAILVLPDRSHCRFLPAGPTRLLKTMAKDLDVWHRQASSPLAAAWIAREGKRLVAGLRFAELVSEKDTAGTSEAPEGRRDR